ncbi:MAG: hypothetical protein NWE94_01920 [Candidatus Bathyarchaeota archaeon]|nr:hypothetical protein [Candidatus Bathyarchaeota archaeon]
MDERQIIAVNQATCNHAKQSQYTRRHFDLLNGFELVVTRCVNCHKPLVMEIKKLR